MSMDVIIHWVSQGKPIKVEGDQLVKCTAGNRIKRHLSKSHNDKEIQKVATFILSQLKNADTVDKSSLLNLADSFVRQNHGKGSIQLFDREVGCHRPKIEYCHRGNQAGLLKWERNGLPSEIYQKHPEFCRFLEDSKILSQMKVTRDTLNEIEGEPAITVNGQPMKWSDLQKQFEFVHSTQYNETFVINKNPSDVVNYRGVYTYLDNGRGLQPHHPYRSERTPVSNLDDEGYEKVLAKAHEFIRPGEEDLSEEERTERNGERPFILQLVTSNVKGPNTNVHNLLLNAKHPYIRLIMGKSNPEINTVKGQVYEVGYGWRQKVKIPFIATQGQFRSPDVWEYNPCEKKVVTNIPLSQSEARALNDYTAKYHRDSINLGRSIGFHLTRQNCSSYINAALNVAGISVPTEISLVNLIKDISPNWLKQVGRCYQSTKKRGSLLLEKVFGFIPQSLKNVVSKVRKAFVKAVHAMAEAVVAFFASLVRLSLGAHKGNGGQAFVAPDSAPKKIVADAADVNKWYKLSSYRINLPGVLQRWQHEQASTVVYDKPMRLAIVP